MKTMLTQSKAATVMIALALVVTACTGQTDTTAPSSPPGASPEFAVGIAVTQADGEEWEDAFELAREVGANTTELTIFWDEFETTPGEFNPDPNWIEIANLVYPDRSVPISLTISVVDTTTIRLPDDLSDRRLDDPEVIARFNSFMTWLAAGLPDVTLTGISIGNEVDIYLGATERWVEYGSFLKATSDHARSLFPDVPVSAKVTVDGLLDLYPARVTALLEDADAYFLTYYHLDDGFMVRPADDIATVITRLDNTLDHRPIHLVELGYPSSELLGSSEQAQATFVRTAMDALASTPEHFHEVNWVWLTDLPPEVPDELAAYYGVDDPRFTAYLGSLGLRHHDGTTKPALDALRLATGN